MLTRYELEILMAGIGVPLAGQALVLKARDESPVRKVNSSIKNVVTHYFSRKMNGVISTESRSAEQAGAYLYEFDPKIIEYWAQPMMVDLHQASIDKKKPVRLIHYPDFLLIKHEEIDIDEWKQEERLIKLSKLQPERYVRDGNTWRSPILENHFAELGIHYRLRSTADIPQCRVQNYRFLADYLDPNAGETSQSAQDALEKLFNECAEIPLSVLLDEAKKNASPYSADDIYRMITVGRLHVDLDSELISDSLRTTIYRDSLSMRLLSNIEKTAKPENGMAIAKTLTTGSMLVFDGCQLEIALMGKSEVALKGTRGVTTLSHGALAKLYDEGRITLPDSSISYVPDRARFHSLNPVQMAEIEDRRNCLVKIEASGFYPNRSERTLRRYRKLVRDAGNNILDQHLALVSRKKNRGNRLPKIPQQLIDLIIKIELERHNTPRAPSKEASYIDFCGACKSIGLAPCSKGTFLRRLRTSVVKREGTRRAYQVNPITAYLYLHDQVHGVRPFEVVHIDCTPLELVVRTPWGKESLGTVILCLAIDAASRAILAFHLSFEKPSARTTMMVIRDLVRRHKRMPEILVVDYGPENNNRQLRRICFLCGTSIRMRPKGAARAGSVLERLFGITHTQFIHLLEGNTKIMKHHRSVTKAVRPEQFAVWTLPALHGALEEYFDILYGMQIHPAHGEAPVTHLKRRTLETGERCNRMVRFDRLFLIETCPSPNDRDCRQVDPIRGIKIDHIWYWSDEFRHISGRKREVQVRIDPWDPGVAFALVDQNWVECVSKYRNLFCYLSWVELRYVINDLRKILSAKKLPLSADRIAAHARVLIPGNFDPRLRAQQDECRAIYQNQGTAAVNGIPPEDENPFKKNVPTLACNEETKVDMPASEVQPSSSEVILEGEIMPPAKDSAKWSFDDDFGLL